jgi:hypothetical protein
VVKRKSPISFLERTRERVVFYYAADKQTYEVNRWCESVLHRESDNLDSVVWDAAKRIYLITTRDDFGGCGKDAWKPHMVPFDSWLNKYCSKVTSAEKVSIER